MYTIYVRDLPGHDPKSITTLAIDVPNSESARSLVRNIATSYPVHLADPFANAYWFEDERGCHEIWYEGDQACSSVGPREAVQDNVPARQSRNAARQTAETFCQAEGRLRAAA